LLKDKTIYPDTVTADLIVQRYMEFNGKLNKKEKNILYLLSSHSRFIGRAAVSDRCLIENLSYPGYIEKKKS